MQQENDSKHHADAKGDFIGGSDSREILTQLSVHFTF